MTKLLYLTKPDQLTCQAQLKSVVSTEDGFLLELDQTPFYPEGGGQPADTGTIHGYRITDVQKNSEGIVYHKTNDAVTLCSNDTVECAVDAHRRLDLTQQHTGQHLLSAIAYHLFDANTVGFHLSETYTTIDLDKKLDAAEIDLLEQTAFNKIAENLEVKSAYPEPEMLSQLPLRKQPKVTEAIRVVSIGDYDYSPCGGTHLTMTCQMKGIKILKTEVYKGGTRLTFVVGERFIQSIQKQQRTVEQFTQKLSATFDTVVEAFEKRELQMNQLKEDIAKLREAALELELSAWLESLEEQLSLGHFSPLTIYQFENRTLEEIKRLSQRFVESQEDSAICITNRLEQMTQFVLVRPKSLESVNCKALLAELSKTYQTKGGGSPLGVQGSLMCPDDTESFIQSLELLYSTTLETN